MKLLSINKRRKGLSELKFDQNLNPKSFNAETGPTGLIAVDTEILLINGICENTELSDQSLAELISKSGIKRAKERALWYLSNADHTRYELFSKLRRSFTEEACSLAISRMEELGLIDDQKYARRFFESCVLEGKRSVREVEYKLKQKGVEKDIISAVKTELFENSDYSPVLVISEIIDKKYREKLLSGDKKDAEKVFLALLRKGFLSSEIKEAFGKFLRDTDFYLED